MKFEFSNPRHLALSWFVFAIAALGLSTLFALLLISSRTPGIGTLFANHNFFDSSLVLHVNLSVIVWVLAASSALHALFTPARLLNMGWIALGIGVLGSLLLAAGPLPGNVAVFKSNYVPVLNSWPFLTGLTLFGMAAGMMALRTIMLLRPWDAELSQRPTTLAAYGSAWAVLLAIVGAIWAFVLTPQSLESAAYFEQLFWGPGHILQLANMLLMLMAWLWLANHWELIGDSSRNWSKIVLFLGVAPLVCVPVLLLLYPPATTDFRTGFTELMRWGSWLAALPLGALILWRIHKQHDLLPAEQTGLRLSITLFLFGIIIGALITADNVMVPAHYHGTVGAVTLALMTVCLHQLPRLGFTAVGETYTRWQLRLYGFGTLIMALGLAVSGWLGVARKLPGDLQALTEPGRIIAMSFAGLGGTMAVLGSALFVIGVFKALLPESARNHRQRVIAAVMMGAVAIQISVVLGAFKQTENAPLPPDPYLNPDGHMQQMAKQELDKRFQQAVTMLHAKQYEYAITALKQVLEIRPDMPEAHVNMGYALLGLKDYKQAVMAFDRATTIRPMQYNAYYGMAEALYEQGDIEGALGAMRSYVHLAPKDDPYLRRANSAIWEWEETVKLRKK